MRKLWLALGMLLVCAPLASAQDFGVMESAETVNQGNFKIRVNPLLTFGKNGGDDNVSVAAMVGYGFTRTCDLEGGIALGDGVRLFGATAEFNVAKDRTVNFSIIPGFHVRRGDKTVHTTGFDVIALTSGHATSKLDLYAALDMAFEKIADDGGDFKTFHLVPGLEYKINQDLEALVEFGIALNDEARHYLSGGLAFYFR